MTAAFLLTIVASVVASTLALSTPLIFASLGGTISERGGVVNIALEGMLLAGAFGYFVGASATHNVFAGIGVAILAAVILGLVLAYLCVRLPVDQVIVGVAVNLMASGGTAFLYRSLFGLGGNQTAPGIGNVSLPGLSHLPFVGAAVFRQSPLTYLALLATLGIWAFLRFTRQGLWLRATGENPAASDSAGISVFWVRFIGVCACGVLCGLGGAFILSQVSSFSEDMTAGVGFIALAAVILGRWEPGGAFLASLLFALFESAQTAMQTAGIHVPYQFLLMLPYVLTILVLAGLGRSLAPAADGTPYRRG
ncbi:MAG: ABC transporter permease [Candidatus Dormibacteraceae bacterium]